MPLVLVPNALTASNLLLGLAGLSLSLQGHGTLAWSLVPVCALLDGLDGTFARSLGVETCFGRYFDTCADSVSFGALPALNFGLCFRVQAGGWAWAAAGTYLACALYRLVRFHRLLRMNPRRRPGQFVGLPTTAGAGVAAGLALLFQGWTPPAPLPIILLSGLSILMVSRIPFPDLLLAATRGGASASLSTPAPASPGQSDTPFGAHRRSGTPAPGGRAAAPGHASSSA